MVFILLSVSGVNILPLPFCLDSFLSFSVEGSCSLHLFSVFFSFHLPGLLLLPILSFTILRCSSVGFLANFFLCWSFSLQGLSPSSWSSQRLVSSGFILSVLVPALSFVLFFVSFVHIRPWAFPSFFRALFVSLFLSTGWFLSFSSGCLKFLILSLIRVVLFSSCLPVFHAASTSSLLPLPRSFCVPSVRGWG